MEDGTVSIFGPVFGVAASAPSSSAVLLTGLSDTEAATVAGIAGQHPEASLKLAAGLDLGTADAARQSPVVQSVWMFLTDLFAAAVPVVPFALFTIGIAAAAACTGLLVGKLIS